MLSGCDGHQCSGTPRAAKLRTAGGSTRTISAPASFGARTASTYQFVAVSRVFAIRVVVDAFSCSPGPIRKHPRKAFPTLYQHSCQVGQVQRKRPSCSYQVVAHLTCTTLGFLRGSMFSLVPIMLTCAACSGFRILPGTSQNDQL